MSRASISTGNIHFNTGNADQKITTKKREQGKPMHILVLGDFSGRSSQGICDTQLSKRRMIEVDRDNFDDVFTTLSPQLNLAISEKPIHFHDYDELHPDYLIDQLDIFEKFKTLKRKLNNRDLFTQAVEEIQQWAPAKNSNDTMDNEEHPDNKSTPSLEGIALPSDMLDSLLSQSQNKIAEQSPIGDIDQLIRSIVSPYIKDKVDPRLPQMISCVDDAIATTLRKILHASHFQELEANWRSLYLLVRRLETSSSLKVFLVDISKDELLDDIEISETIESSQSYALLVDKFRVAGSIAPAILQCNYYINDTDNGLVLTNHLAQLAEMNNAITLCGVSEKIAGCSDLTTNRDDWNYTLGTEFNESWQTIRQQSYSKHIAVIAPRFLLRLPYGKRTSPIESFPFEELGDKNKHHHYLWANSNTLVTLALAQNYTQYGWECNTVPTCPEIDDLPVHIFTDEDGDSAAQAIAEIYITDKEVEKFAEQGILTIRSMKNKNAVLIPRFRTLCLNETSIFA